MRRFQFPNAALVAGLAVLLSGCSGETPTAPGTVTPPGGTPPGACTTLVALTATTDAPFAGSGSIVRATVTLNGVPVADGGSVQFATSLGSFVENGLNTISKTIVGGVADVTVVSSSSGTAQVTAVYTCARGQKNLQFQGLPDAGPVITSFLPTNGSCAGGDTVTINGVRLGNGTNVRVFFGGIEGSVTTATNTQIKVLTPARTLNNPSVPESVSVTVFVNGVSSAPASVPFTYSCIGPEQKISISSITPTAGAPAGGDLVSILGRNFGTTIATTQVTFCGRSAQIVSQTDQLIVVSSPTHLLANPAVSENCDVVVTRDIGLLSQQSATAPKPFTYSGSGSGGSCNTDPTFFIASLSPNTGPPDGGTAVTITGSGFGPTAGLIRVDFAGIPATITSINNTTIVVSTPRRTLASPNVPETVDITVTDLGSATQRCTRVFNAFVYSAKALDPVIYSSSPKTGPNDASTRVSIFGDGFQFPMQVFMTGGGCGAQLVEAAVSDISLNTIVFKTPIAVGANVCLANSLVDIVIQNPATGKTANIPAAFKYYSCPTITSFGPGFGPYLGGTQVIITGHNFEEPAVVNGGGTAWSPISVSSQQIIAVTPPLIVTGCADVTGPVLVTGTSLSCTPATSAPSLFTYYVKSVSPFISDIAPPSVPEAGGTVVTITGGNFIDTNMRVKLVMPSGPPLQFFPATKTPTVITFTAPAFVGNFTQAPCLVGTVAGTRNVNTPVELDVVNVTTTCVGADQLVYVPLDTSCRLAPLSITTLTLPDGKLATAYSQVLAATGGTGTYTFTTPGPLPAGLFMNASGAITGTPTALGTSSFTVTVNDGQTTAARTLTITVGP